MSFDNTPADTSHLKFTCSKTVRESYRKKVLCSKLTIKAPERCRSGVFFVNFKHFSHVFLLLTLNKSM